MAIVIRRWKDEVGSRRRPVFDFDDEQYHILGGMVVDSNCLQASSFITKKSVL
jgi:hypothetical protein